MQKCEYLILEAQDMTPLRVNRVDAKTAMPDVERGTHLPEFLNKLGADGWELVGTALEGFSSSTNYYIFKRPQP